MSKLMGNKTFGSTNIENVIPYEIISQQNNTCTIPKKLGKSDKYRVIGSRIVPNRRDGNQGK